MAPYGIYCCSNTTGKGNKLLILSRRLGEEIVVGNNILIKIIEILPGRVRIGFTAPRDIPIHRVELINPDVGKEWGMNASDN